MLKTLKISEDERKRPVADNIIAVKTDPYGFWHLEEEGKKLDGLYTSVTEAEAGAKDYLKKKECLET